MATQTNGPMTLYELLELRMQDDDAPLRKAVVWNYRSMINRFRDFRALTPTLLDLREDRLARWEAAMADDGVTKEAIVCRIRVIRALWSWAARQGLVANGPTLRHQGRAAKMRGDDVDYDSTNHPPICAESPLLLDVYENEYEPLHLRNRSENTLKLYRVTLRAFDRVLGRPATLADLNDETVSQFLRERRHNGAAARTANRDLINLLAIWRWAHRKGYVSDWPEVEREKAPKRTPRALTKDELSRLLQAARSEDRPVGQTPGSLWWPALLLTCWDTGERISGVLGLTWDRCDLSGGWVTFRAEDRKGGREDNTMQIAPDTVAAIGKLPRSGHKVFLWPYHDNYIWTRYEYILKRAELPTTREFKFHCIRRSMASWFEEAGGNATEALRHSSRRITEAYIDPRIKKTKAAVDLLFRPEDDPSDNHEGGAS